MKQYTYQEIFYASSERGIFSGDAGFGVRTCTKGMESMDVDTIVNACSPGYAVYNDRILDKDRILANPDIVYDYPPVYIFRIVTMNDGSKRYVFGRTIYIGVDYGFFKEINAYDRTGTNYLTHLMVFGEEPTPSLIGQLLFNSKYSPVNYSCAPNNEELKALLTGTPEYLPEQSVSIEEEGDVAKVSPDTSLFVQGLVQMLKNRTLQPDGNIPKKMYVKCPWKSVEACLGALSLFPRENIGDIQYITNYMQGYGIPDGYDIAFVNEYNETELYDSNYVTVDFFSGDNKNLQRNYILDKIELLMQQNDMLSAAQLIQFYLGLKEVPEEDYEFYYNIFTGAVSDLKITLADLTDTTVRKLPGLQLDEARSSKFWAKVNTALNEGLSSTQGKEFMLAVDRVKEIGKYCPNKIQIQDNSINYVTNILFSGKGNFGKIANENNVSTLLQLVNKTLIPSEELFLKSLKESSNEKVWEASLPFYYEGQYEGKNEILTAVFESSLSENDISLLVTTVFPMSKYADMLFDFFRSNPTTIQQAKSLVTSLVNHYGAKRYSEFIWLGQIAPGLTAIVTPIISDYYQKEANADVKKGASELFGFLEEVGVERIGELNLWPVLKTIAKRYLHEPLPDIKSFLSKLEELKVPYQSYMQDEVVALDTLANQKIPDKVSTPFVKAAVKGYPDDKKYLEQVFSLWLRGNVSKEEVATFVSENKKKLDDKHIEWLVETIWNCASPNVNSVRDSLILSVIDHYGWGRSRVEEYSHKCGNKDLEKFLLKSNGIFDKLFRKIFK